MSEVLVVEHGPEIGQVTAFCYDTVISMPMVRRLRLQRPVMPEPLPGQARSPGRA
jgi:hypothetical protein